MDRYTNERLSECSTLTERQNVLAFIRMEAKEANHYDYEDQGFGVLLKSPRGTTVWLQGDDANSFLSDVNDIDTIWYECGNPNPSIFKQVEDHIDLLIDAYFD